MSLTEHLRNGQQCDEDGVMCIVSRQACHEAADDLDRMRGLLWFAWHEFNAIRARDGAPTADGVPLVVEDWWSKMTDAFAKAIGPDAQTPWPSKEAREASGLMEKSERN